MVRYTWLLRTKELVRAFGQSVPREGERGGITTIYKPYRYVPPQRVAFSSISSLK